MPNPPQSLLSLEQAYSTCSVTGGESRGRKKREWLELNLLLFFAQNTLPPLFSPQFVQHLTLFLPFLPSFSFQLWLRAQIPNVWDKHRKREIQGERGRWEVMRCKCCVMWPLGAKGDNVACVCLCFCLCWLWVFVYFLVKCTIVQRCRDCVYLSLFSSAGGEEREWKRKHETDIWGIWEKNGRVDRDVGVLEMRE